MTPDFESREYEELKAQLDAMQGERVNVGQMKKRNRRVSFAPRDLLMHPTFEDKWAAFFAPK